MCVAGSVGRAGLRMSTLMCLLAVCVAVAVAYPPRAEGDSHLKSLYYNRADGLPAGQYEGDNNVWLYLLSKNAKSSPRSHYHYASKKSLDKLGGGNLVKRNLVNPVYVDDVALSNNELPCLFEYYVNSDNEVVMACSHEKSLD